MPDLGQVPQLDPRVMTVGLKAVITGVKGDRVKLDQQVRLSGDPGWTAASCRSRRAARPGRRR